MQNYVSLFVHLFVGQFVCVYLSVCLSVIDSNATTIRQRLSVQSTSLVVPGPSFTLMYFVVTERTFSEIQTAACKSCCMLRIA